MLARVNRADFGGGEAALGSTSRPPRAWPASAADRNAARRQSRTSGCGAAGTLTLAYDADDLALLPAASARPCVGTSSPTSPNRAPPRAVPGPARRRRRGPPRTTRVDPARDARRAARRARRPRHRGCRSATGARVVRASATRLALDGGRVVGVHDDAGRLPPRAGAVVVAAGWQSGALLAERAGRRCAAHAAVKGQDAAARRGPGPQALEHVVRGLSGRPVYVSAARPRASGARGHREVVVGPRRGNPDDRRAAAAGGVFALPRDARALLAGIDEAALVEVTPRARPATPDNLPARRAERHPRGCTPRRATAATASSSPRSRRTPSSPGSAGSPGWAGPGPRRRRRGARLATAPPRAASPRTATTPRGEVVTAPAPTALVNGEPYPLDGGRRPGAARRRARPRLRRRRHAAGRRGGRRGRRRAARRRGDDRR